MAVFNEGQKRMGFFTAVLVLLFFPGGAGSLAAQETETILTVDECLTLAAEHDAGLRQKALDLQSALLTEKSQASLWLPSLSARGGVSSSGTLLETESPQAYPQIGSSLSLSASLPFSWGTLTAMKNGELAAASAELAYQEARQELVKKVTLAFYALLLDEERLTLLEEEAQLARQLYQQSEIRFSNGLINEMSLLRAQLSLEQAKQALIRSRSSLNLSRRNFQSLLGLKGEAFRLQGNLQEAAESVLGSDFFQEGVQAGAAALVGRRSEVLAAEIQYRQREASLAGLKVGRLPSLSVSGGWSFSFAEVFEEPSRDSFSLGLSLSVPLDDWLPGSKTSVDLRNAQRSLEQADLSRQQAAEKAELALLNSAAALDAAVQDREITRLQVEIAQKSYALAEEAFARGRLEQLQLEENRKELLTARLNNLNSEKSLLTAWMDLAVLMEEYQL